jgi:hypothetical protein
MTARSFETINYMLRPNKNVERKLIAESLLYLRSEFDISKYRYVGFGSMWFSDFVLMHKLVGMEDMVTIESEGSRRKRVEFNRPYGRIVISMKKAASALSEVIDDTPSVVWLDYDGPLKAAMDGDLETAIGSMSSGSMILVSVNAVADQLKGNKRDGEDLSPEEYLADVCDDDELRNLDQRWLTRNGFPSFVGDLLHARLKSAVLDRKPDCEYRPIWSFQYSDGAAMVTVGGMVTNKADSIKLTNCQMDRLTYLSPTMLYKIALPILTEKEKRALDRLLPSATPLDCRSLDFELRQAEVDAYQKFYRHYPVFNEMAT